MLNILFQDDMTEEESEKLVNRKWLEFPDKWFDTLTRSVNLNNDDWFKLVLLDIDKSDIPIDNVARDIYTGRTHPFSNVSSGVKMLWLMYYHADKFLFPSQYLGENCYQYALYAGENSDVFVYDDSDMLRSEERGVSLDSCIGVFKDYVKGNVVSVNGDGDSLIAFMYANNRGDM